MPEDDMPLSELLYAASKNADKEVTRMMPVTNNWLRWIAERAKQLEAKTANWDLVQTIPPDWVLYHSSVGNGNGWGCDTLDRASDGLIEIYNTVEDALTTLGNRNE